MKKFLYILLGVLLAGVIIISCKKEQPPVVVVPTYTITVTKTGNGSVVTDKLSGLVLGSNVDFKFTPESGYSLYSVKINGIKVDDIIPSSTEVSYTVRDIKTNITVEVTFVETRLLMVSVKSTQEQPWKWIKLDLYRASDNTFIGVSALTQAEKDRSYYFVFPSMELVVLNPDNSIHFKGTWDLKQNVFYRASEVMSIWEISKTKIVIAAVPIWSQFDNCYIFAVYTYERI